MGRKKLEPHKRKKQLVVRASIESYVVDRIPKEILADLYTEISLKYEQEIRALYEKYK